MISVSFTYWAVCSWDMEYAYFKYTINDGPLQVGWEAPWWFLWWDHTKYPEGEVVYGWVRTGRVYGKECTASPGDCVLNSKTIDIEIDLTISSTIYIEC